MLDVCIGGKINVCTHHFSMLHVCVAVGHTCLFSTNVYTFSYHLLDTAWSNFK